MKIATFSAGTVDNSNGHYYVHLVPSDTNLSKAWWNNLTDAIEKHNKHPWSREEDKWWPQLFIPTEDERAYIVVPQCVIDEDLPERFVSSQLVALNDLIQRVAKMYPEEI